jgi:GT2 family glycosyltransferase
MIRADVIRQVGMLDERFFAYYEETEWCARVRKAGYEIHIIPEAKIWHKNSPEARKHQHR